MSDKRIVVIDSKWSVDIIEDKVKGYPTYILYRYGEVMHGELDNVHTALIHALAKAQDNNT